MCIQNGKFRILGFGLKGVADTEGGGGTPPFLQKLKYATFVLKYFKNQKKY